MRAGQKRERYHHGDLHHALIDVTVELIADHGVDSFSLAEASRRLGVAASAPYRHFADRDELLTAVAVRATEVLVATVQTEVAADDETRADDADGHSDGHADGRRGGDPRRRLAALARGYVRFAAANPALFSAFTRARHRREPEKAAGPVKDLMLADALALSDGDIDRAEALAIAVGAVAHGYAELLRLTGPGTPAGQTTPHQAVPRSVDATAAQAGAAVLALVAGRAELSTPTGDPSPRTTSRP